MTLFELVKQTIHVRDAAKITACKSIAVGCAAAIPR